MLRGFLCVSGALVLIAASTVGCGGDDDTTPSTPSVGGSGGGSGGALTGGNGTGAVNPVGGTSGTGGAPPGGSCPTPGGVCTPTVLDTGITGPAWLTLSAGHLYYRTKYLAGTRDPNSVLRVRLPTGAPEVVADVGQGELVTILAGIAVDSTHVYVGDAMRGLSRVALPGGALELLVGDGPMYLALDEAHVYYTTNASSEVVRIPKTGGTREVLASGHSAFLIALDATHVYWSVDTPPYALRRTPKAGGATELIADGLTLLPERMLVHSGFLFVALSDREGTVPSRGVIRRYPVGGGAPEELYSAPEPISALTTDGEALFVGTCPDTAGLAEIRKLPLAGGAATTLERGGDCYVDAAVDATSVYFSDYGAPARGDTTLGSVLAVNKCGCP